MRDSVCMSGIIPWKKKEGDPIFWDMDPKNHERDLKAVSDFLLSLFEFASDTKSSSFEKAEWTAFAGRDGEWLYELYEKDSVNGKAMRRAVDHLFEKSQTKRKEICQAIAHDMAYPQNLKKNFRFQSIRLDRESRKIIEDFFLYFYRIVLCTSHFRLKGLTSPRYGRKELARSYFKGTNEALKYICPVCLQSVTAGEREHDIEHYFGKTFIPCLALHPYNLYFCCPSCNERYKRAEIPFQRGERDVEKIFLPYLDTVRDKVKLRFRKDADQERVEFCPADEEEPYAQEKIDAFERLFHLQERWSGLLDYYYKTRKQQYESMKLDDLEALREEMEKDLQSGELRMYSRPETYLETHYLEWICRENLKAFYANMKHTGRKPVKI